MERLRLAMCFLLTHQKVLHVSVAVSSTGLPLSGFWLRDFCHLVYWKGSWSFSLSWGVKASMCSSKLRIVLNGPMTMKPFELFQHRSKNLLGLDPLLLRGYQPLQGLILRRARLQLVSHLLGPSICPFHQKCQYCTFPCCRCDTLHVLHRCKLHVNW